MHSKLIMTSVLDLAHNKDRLPNQAFSLSLSLKVIRDVLSLGHRQAFAWVDEWIGM